MRFIMLSDGLFLDLSGHKYFNLYNDAFQLDCLDVRER